MSYQVLARKWRPRNFQEMMGQEHVLRALINALDSQRLHHAYLFTGTRGVGKTTVARIFAKSLNCQQGITSRPCGVCGACREIDEGRFVDLIEVDAASRTKVEDTRELLENVQYSPTSGRFKVYLIDEVHMLSTHSFNALLKTLEEPPPHVKFLLATTDPQRLPVTILSRCLQFNLKRMAAETIRAHLTHVLGQEGIAAEPAALSQLARAADGSMRDALSLLDQAIAYGGGQVNEADVRSMLGSIEHGQVVALAEALAARDGAALLRHSAALAEFAPDYSDVLAELISLLYQVAVVQAVPAAAGDEVYAEAAARLADVMSPEDVQLFYQIGLIGRRDLPLAPAPRSGFEMVLLRMLAFVPVVAEDAAASAPPVAAAPRRAAPATAATPPVSASPVPRPPVEQVAAAGHSKAAIGSAPAAALKADDWNALIEALRLHGIARELAVNCSLKARDGDVFHLVIAPVHASLRNARLEQRLQDSLSTHLGKPVKLVFTIAAPEAETPALMKERVSQDRMRAAQDAIAQDGNVKILQEMFEARVVPESVQPVD